MVNVRQTLNSISNFTRWGPVLCVVYKGDVGGWRRLDSLLPFPLVLPATPRHSFSLLLLTARSLCYSPPLISIRLPPLVRPIFSLSMPPRSSARSRKPTSPSATITAPVPPRVPPKPIAEKSSKYHDFEHFRTLTSFYPGTRKRPAGADPTAVQPQKKQRVSGSALQLQPTTANGMSIHAS